MRLRGLALLVAAAALTGCAERTAAPAAGGGDGGAAKVRIALDWTPNTNHTGLYVGLEKGWYREAGLDVEILPYADTATTTLVANGRADFGVASQDDITFARAAGQKVVSVLPITQRDAVEIGVRSDSPYHSPRDLDGKTYAGFGLPSEMPVLQAIIRRDGGEGRFENVTLNTAAYEAVYAGRADFTLPFVTWEGIEARLRGKPFRTFRPSDFGVPNRYSALIFSSDRYVAAQDDVARRFVAVTQRGFQWAADHPGEGADILIARNASFLKEPRLVHESADLLAQRYYRDGQGRVGTQSPAQWQELTDFLFKAGVLVDRTGKPLDAPPDASAMFTTDLIEGDGE